MMFVRTFKQIAVAAAAVASLGAQAATFASPVDLEFTLSQDILSLLGSTPVINTFGGATVSGLTITLPTSATTMSSSAATDLISSSTSTAKFDVVLTSSSGTVTTLSMSNFVYDNSAKSLAATVLYNGVAANYTGPTFTTASSTVSTPFNASTYSGTLTTANVFLTTAAANGLMTTMGLSTFQQGLFRSSLTGTAFGALTVQAVPEPSTYALMGLGLVGVALAARKRQAA
jgi:hypothetical protein